MIERTFVFLTALLLSGTYSLSVSAGVDNPIPNGFARLHVVRAEEPLLYRQDALIALNGRPIGSLARGTSLTLDLAPGIWRLSARTRPSAEQAIVEIKLEANRISRIRVELDPSRFPPERNTTGLLDLVRNSLEAPIDDRLPLFMLRTLAPETPEGETDH